MASVLVGLLMTETKLPASGLREAAELALAEARERDGIEFDIEFMEIQVDGPPAGRVFNVEAALREMDRAGAIGVLGLANSDSCMAVLPLVDELRLPTICGGSSAALQSRYMFCVQWGSCPEEAFLMIDYLASQGARRVGIVWDMLWHSGEWVEYMRLAARRWGLEVVGDVRVPAPTTAHTTAPAERSLRIAREGLERLRSLQPDALALLPAMAAPSVMQVLGEMDWRVPYVGNLGFAVHRMDPGLIDGAVHVSLLDEANPATADFLRRHELVFGRAPAVMHQSLTHYDQARAMFEGLSLAPIWSREGLLTGLERVKVLASVQGAAGTYINFSPWDHRGVKGESPMVLRRFGKDGSRVIHRYQGLYREAARLEPQR